jgi:hypothetical protein
VRRKEAGFYSAMALVMAGVLALVSIPLETSSTESSTQTSTETPGCQGRTVIQNATGDPNCLRLVVGVNSTTLSAGQSLQISVNLVNGLQYSNNVSVPAVPYGPTGSFEFGGFSIATWPGCLFPAPLQFIVVEGNYTVDSLPAADPDYGLGGQMCAEGQTATQFTFGADSDSVNVTAVSCMGNCSPATRLPTSYRLDSEFTVMGYWNVTYARIHPLLAFSTKSSNGGGSTFGYPEVAPLGQIPFVPGVYTLAVSTMWGQAELVHFTVK